MCFNVKVYSRATWGARNPKSVTAMQTPASLFFVHHTEGNYVMTSPPAQHKFAVFKTTTWIPKVLKRTQ